MLREDHPAGGYCCRSLIHPIHDPLHRCDSIAEILQMTKKVGAGEHKANKQLGKLKKLISYYYYYA